METSTVEGRPQDQHEEVKSWIDKGAEERRQKRRALAELGERIAALASRIDVAQQRLLTMIREFDERGGWGQQGALSCAHWLSWRLGLDLVTAREKVRVARALGRLPLVDEAYRKGRISYSKVRAITRVATPDNEERLLDYGLQSTGATMEKIVRSYRRVVEPQIDGIIPEVDAERYVRSYTVSHGIVRIEAQLHADEAAIVLKALDGLRFTATRKDNRARRKAAGGRGSAVHPNGAVPALEETPPVDDSVQRQVAGGDEDGRRGDDSAESSSVVEGPRIMEEGTPPFETSKEGRAENRDEGGKDGASSSAESEGTAPVEAPVNGQVEGAGEGTRRRVDDSAESLQSWEGQTGPAGETRPSFTAADGPPRSRPATLPGAGVLARSVERPAFLKAFDRADALVALAQSVLDAGAIRGPAMASRFEVVMTVDAASLRGESETLATIDRGPGVPSRLARMVACDAALVPMAVDEKGEVLNVGRRRRTIPPSIRRALRRRDGGCRFPGCLHDRFVDGHHIVHWADGGETKMRNLILLCRHHHRLVHEDGFTVSVEEGEPVFRGPAGEILREVPYRPEVGKSVLETRGFLRGLSEFELELELEPEEREGGKGEVQGKVRGEAEGEGVGGRLRGRGAVAGLEGPDGSSAVIDEPDGSERRADGQGVEGYPLADALFGWDLGLAVEGLIRAGERGARERPQA